MLTLISIQEKLIARLHDIDANGVGEHKRRSNAGARKAARKELAAIGFDEAAIEQAIRDAVDMFELERNADE